MNTYAAFVSSGMIGIIADDIKTGDTITRADVQVKSKPAIEDVVCHLLEGSNLKNALNFIDYVRASKMKIKWSAVNVWSVRYKNKHVLDIALRPNTWRVNLVLDHMASNSVFTKREEECIRNLIGMMRDSMPEQLEPTPALS